MTYGQIAALVGCKSAQAVGSTVGRNPISIIVPCHRVVGAGGSLTGYAGGLDKKAALLQLETQVAQREPSAPALFLGFYLVYIKSFRRMRPERLPDQDSSGGDAAKSRQ